MAPAPHHVPCLFGERLHLLDLGTTRIQPSFIGSGNGCNRMLRTVSAGRFSDSLELQHTKEASSRNYTRQASARLYLGGTNSNQVAPLQLRVQCRPKSLTCTLWLLPYSPIHRRPSFRARLIPNLLSSIHLIYWGTKSAGGSLGCYISPQFHLILSQVQWSGYLRYALKCSIRSKRPLPIVARIAVNPGSPVSPTHFGDES